MLRRALTVAALAALALTGCQAIPTSGSVQEGLSSFDQADQPVQYNPDGPVEGASQEDIVRGFIRAVKSSVDDYAVAREFLAPAYADEWDPSAGVFVDEGTQSYHALDELTGELSLTGLATVDERGQLTPLPEGDETEMRFEFAEVHGEWRIVSAPNGVILDRSTFASVWTSRQLYFFTADDRLVAETRWFLNKATLSTQIVNELLAGPIEADAQALRTAFPSGTVLATNSVPVTDGTARIDFSSELLTGDASTMELVTRQLATSLQSAPGVIRFEISVAGAVIEEGPVTAPESEHTGTESVSTVVLTDGVFGPLTAGETAPLSGIGEKIADLAPLGVTLSTDRSHAAVRHAVPSGESVSWVGEDDVVSLDLRPGLIDPALDRYGYVWSYASSAPDTILVQRPGSDAKLLQVPGLAGGTVSAVRVSPGGNRIAWLVTDASGRSVVLVVSIVRDAEQQPTALAEAAQIAAWLPGAAVDIDWVEEMRLVAVSQSAANAKVALVPLGQLATDAGTIPNAVQVTGGGARSKIRLLDGSGRLYGPQGSGWQLQSSGIDLIAR